MLLLTNARWLTLEYRKLKELIDIKTGKLDANANSKNGKYPFFTCSKDTLKIDTYSYDCECVLLAGNGDLNVKYYKGKFDAYQRTYILECKNNVICTKYLYYFMQKYVETLRNQAIGGIIKYIKLSNINDALMPIYNTNEQGKIIKEISQVEEIINIRKKQLIELENIIKSQFVEMFGNLEINNKKWKIVNILEVASIDTNMTKDFEKYAELPHIGIENIEKNTGKLINYISVAKSNLTSGKYIFDERHIIYSKIRPNLNKVATPDFKGLCSADSYPILTNEKCKKEYLVFVLRSDYFLNYILSYSSRTNIPKVNKEQLSGFDFPLPPIDLQNQFADIVKQIDKQKFETQKNLKEMQELQESLMNKYFGG